MWVCMRKQFPALGYYYNNDMQWRNVRYPQQFSGMPVAKISRKINGTGKYIQLNYRKNFWPIIYYAKIKWNKSVILTNILASGTTETISTDASEFCPGDIFTSTAIKAWHFGTRIAYNRISRAFIISNTKLLNADWLRREQLFHRLYWTTYS